MVEVMRQFAARVSRTDVARNWIMWHGIVGDFIHADPLCRPPYLREASHARSLGAPTEVVYHQASFLDVLRAAPAASWSHYNFSDALDWMPDAVQAAVFREVLRTARPGAILINRTVDLDDPLERLGLADRFRRIEPASREATAAERSCLYRRVDLYRIAP
jgi:S-adenosylmethionine-diacylglycerol 3-amino-3-carboxypropyl transferase